jgi:DNA-directed RNA polymerase subunit RPC12/RpoP
MSILTYRCADCDTTVKASHGWRIVAASMLERAVGEDGRSRCPSCRNVDGEMERLECIQAGQAVVHAAAAERVIEKANAPSAVVEPEAALAARIKGDKQKKARK